MPAIGMPTHKSAMKPVKQDLNFVFKNGRRKKDQSLSILFGKLNYDIRQLIYKELFGDKRVHIKSSEWCDAIGGFGNKSDTPGLYHTVCKKDGEGKPHNCHSGRREYLCFSTGIMFACKATYEESILILYTQNKFSFSDIPTINMFANYAGRYTHLIRNLEIYVPKQPAAEHGQWMRNMICLPAIRRRLHVDHADIRINIAHQLVTANAVTERDENGNLDDSRMKRAMARSMGKSVEILVPRDLFKLIKKRPRIHIPGRGMIQVTPTESYMNNRVYERLYENDTATVWDFVSFLDDSQDEADDDDEDDDMDDNDEHNDDGAGDSSEDDESDSDADMIL
ncbi:hypothetical protein B0T10DRAFT_573575 [Thelonectria olida]|uniref:DUF7730 domain-containing protein n=1 Tax=Thelonectria olida TaxID=1576542 RepID=A0A9P8W2L8_9HYPO|nr:hypothetical protein B0T10DRAFT_573575 [Thelonectria olida]